MFTTRMAEARTSKVELQDVSFATVQAIVDFAYTANIKLDDSNVQDLLSAANQYQVLHTRTRTHMGLVTRKGPLWHESLSYQKKDGWVTPDQQKDDPSILLLV